MVATAEAARSRMARPGGRRLPAALLAAPFIVCLALVFLVPVGYLVSQSFHDAQGNWSLSSYDQVLTSSSAQVILKDTAIVTSVVTISCLIIGFAIALTIQQSPPLVRAALLIAVIAPFFVTVTVRIFGWLALTSRPSPVVDVIEWIFRDSSQRTIGMPIVSLALIQIFLPFAVLPILSSLAKVDPQIVRSARSLGAGPWTVLRKILIPLAVPGLLVGAVLVFAQTISSFFVPAILGGGFLQLLPNAVVDNITLYFAPHVAAAAAVVLSTASLLVIFGLTLIIRSRAGIYRAARTTTSSLETSAQS